MKREYALALGYFAQAASMVLTAGAMMGKADPWVVYLCAAFAGSAVTLTRPVHGALLATLSATPKELTAANAVTSWVEGLGGFVGPMFAAVLMNVSGPGAVFAIMGLGQFFAVFLAFGAHPPPDQVADAPPLEVSTPLFSGLIAGIQEARGESGTFLVLWLLTVQFVIVGMLDVLIVALAIEALRAPAAGPGLLTSALGVGALFGAASAVALFGRKRLGGPLVLGALVNGVPLLLLGLPLGFVAAFVLLAFSGMGKSLSDVASRTLLQRSVRGDALSRVLGLQEGLAMVGLALGSVLAPVLVASLGVRGAFAGAGLMLPAAALAAWRGLQALDDRGTVPEREFAILANVSIFKPLSAIVLERLCSRSVPLIACDEVVIREGDHGDLFYVIDEGFVDVTKAGRPVAVLGPGEYFGEIALLRDVRRTATCTAKGSVRLLTLSRAEFLAAVTGSRQSAEAAEREIARRHHPEGETPGEPAAQTVTP